MSSFVGALVSDQWLQSQFTQVELRTLKSKYVSQRTLSGRVTVGDLPHVFNKLKAFFELFTDDEIKDVLAESYQNMDDEIDFESFLRAHLNLQARAIAKDGGSKSSSSFLRAATSTIHHAINESEKASYVAHISSYLAEDKLMNHLKKAGYEKQVTNFSSDVKDGEAYAYLLSALAPEVAGPGALTTTDPTERAKMVLEQAERLDCKRHLTPKDIVEGSPNLNLAFVAQIFRHRNGLTID
ncbi:unnamed protein product [Lathyrus sativus]|nr:unnamed protein product [Lathyrus sativus]